jgi:putative CocE/NonD family hydrolase
MKRKLDQAWRTALALLLILALVPLVLEPVEAQEETPVSKPGAYSGYSEPIYDEWVHTSQYVTVRDGTKLAVSVFRPARDGEPVAEPLPVVWTHTRYHRSTRLRPMLQTALKHGYVIGEVDVRGGGASYGTRRGPFAPEEAMDAYDVTEWFAAQPWCSGNIGMYGRSYLGITQYMAASTAPPHLKAIVPEMAMFDMYSFVHPGGVFHNDFVAQWDRVVKLLDTVSLAPPVDEDSDGSMLAEAIKEHQANRDVYEMAASQPYRDSLDEETNSMLYTTHSPSNYVNEVKNSGVAVYHWVGWYDMYPRAALLWFSNLDNPQRIVIGPWNHSAYSGLDLVTEHLRWYDYWLKGIDNGIMDEAPIYYYTMGAPKGQEWRSAWQWPLPQEQPTNYYLRGQASESVNSVNDGVLSIRPPTDASGKDDYVVDYITTSGKATRWTNGYGGGFDYPDMTRNDEKGLTYTTPPLDSDLEVTGHPVVHLWVTSTAQDGDFFVYLEEVDEDGYSHYITEGTLRASHRAISTPPFDYLGLPYHRSFAEDLVDLPSEPVELVFDLLPTSNIFDAEHRIRVTITCADKDTALTPELSPPPTVSVYHNSDHASYITLPIIPAATEDEEAVLPSATLEEPASEEATLPLVAIVVAIALTAIVVAVVLIKFIKKPATET